MQTLPRPPTPKKSKNPKTRQPTKNNQRPKTKQKTRETTPMTITRILKYLSVYGNCSKKYFFKCSFNLGASLVAQLVKNLPTMPETRVRFLGREDLLEKQMATHSSIPAWIIPGTEEPEGLQSMGRESWDTT